MAKRHSNPSSTIYKFARMVNNIDALEHPRRLHRRVKNIFLGRLLGKLKSGGEAFFLPVGVDANDHTNPCLAGFIL